MTHVKPKLVLMAGFGGSGKTTLAHALGSRLKWPVLDKDVIKSKIIHSSGVSIEDASSIAYNLLFAQAQDILVYQQLSVILDSSAAFLPVIAFANELVQVANVQMKIVFCKVCRPIRQERLQRRNELDGGRRQLLIDLTTIDGDNWQYFDHLPLEHLIEIDTSQPFEEYLQRALYFVREEHPYRCPLTPIKESF